MTKKLETYTGNEIVDVSKENSQKSYGVGNYIRGLVAVGLIGLASMVEGVSLDQEI